MDLEQQLDKWGITDKRMRERIQKLELSGFKIYKAWPKGKVWMSWPWHPDKKFRRDRKSYILQGINRAVGDDWEGIKFKNGTIYLWWPGGD